MKNKNQFLQTVKPLLSDKIKSFGKIILVEPWNYYTNRNKI